MTLKFCRACLFGWCAFLFCFAPSVFALEIKIELDGLDSAEKTNALAFLSLERERKNPALSEARLRYLHAKAPDEIAKALQPFGYFSAQINSQIEHIDSQFRVRYQVDPGKRLAYQRIAIDITGEGTQDPSIRAVFDIKPGDFVNQPKYDEAKQALINQALQQGYLNARFTQQRLEVDLGEGQANIDLGLDTGPLFRFGEVTYQQEALSDEFIRRLQNFAPGEPFSQEKLLALQANLLNGDYFSQAEINILRDQATDGRVPLEVLLTPTKANRYRFGVGFSTDNGPRASVDWLRRRVGNEGQKFRTGLSVSAPESSITANYTIPLERPRVDFLTFGAGATLYDTDARRGQRYFLNASKSESRTDNWRRTLGLELSYEDYDIAGVEEQALFLIPSIGWSHKKTDGKDFSLSGHRIEYKLLGAVKPILSDATFVQAYANDKLIIGLSDNWRLLTRVELGANLINSPENLPASQRFFAGGDSSIRGFQLESLGPRNSANDIVGGRFLAVGSIEFERRILGNWSGAVFSDFGNAFDPELRNHVAYSVGFGGRYRSPIGPIRVDLASAISEPGSPLRLHILVGAEF